MKKPTRILKFLLLIPLLFFQAPALFASSASVTNANDSGDYSLRDAITSIDNLPGATNVIDMTLASGDLWLLSDLPSIRYNTTLALGNYGFIIEDSTNVMYIDAAVTIYNNSSQSTFTIHEDIGGTGSLIKTGDGYLVLTGTNSYTGGTYINGGILATNWNGALGAAGGLLSFDGGTLRALNSLYINRPVTLNSGGGTFDNNSYLISLSGVISGSGALYKTGDGTLILGAANTYLGTTTVNTGTLQLAVDYAIPQASTVTVASGSTVDMGGYKQEIASYSGAGTLALKLQAGVTNLTVAGAANVSDSTLHITYDPQIINSGDTFTPITAGILNGKFTTITSPAAVIFTPDYSSGNSLVLTASLVPFASIGANANQKAVGAGLEPLRASPSGDIAQVLGELYTLYKADLSSALDQLSPVSLMSMRGLAYSASEMTAAALKPRLAEIASGGGGGFSSYYSPGSDGDDVSLDEAESLVKNKKGADPKQQNDASQWGFFASASGDLGETLTHKDGEKEGPGYTFYGGGLVAGTDYRLWENVAIGALGAYTQGQASVYAPSKATVQNTSARYGLYAAAAFGSLRTGFYAGKAADTFDTSRSVIFGGISRKASANPSGQETNVQADAAYDFGTLADGGVTAPYASLAYDALKTDSFLEKGADSVDISAGAMSASSLRSTAGLRFSEVMAYGGSRISTTISAGWSHEFRDQDLELTSSFAAGGAPFAVYSGDAVRDALKVGARIICEWEGGISSYLEYAGDFRSRYHSHSGSAGLSLQF